METIAPSTTFFASAAEELLRASKLEARGSFPQGDCQKIVAKAGGEFESLAADLDAYFYDIWSPSNGIKMLSKKPEPWLRDLKEYLEKSFFARHTKYAPLEAMINQDDTPDLYQNLMVYDKMRKDLLFLLSEMLIQRGSLKRNGI